MDKIQAVYNNNEKVRTREMADKKIFAEHDNKMSAEIGIFNKSASA